MPDRRLHAQEFRGDVPGGHPEGGHRAHGDHAASTPRAPGDVSRQRPALTLVAHRAATSLHPAVVVARTVQLGVSEHGMMAAIGVAGGEAAFVCADLSRPAQIRPHAQALWTPRHLAQQRHRLPARARHRAGQEGLGHHPERATVSWTTGRKGGISIVSKTRSRTSCSTWSGKGPCGAATAATAGRLATSMGPGCTHDGRKCCELLTREGIHHMVNPHDFGLLWGRVCAIEDALHAVVAESSSSEQIKQHLQDLLCQPNTTAVPQSEEYRSYKCSIEGILKGPPTAQSRMDCQGEDC